MNTSTKVKSWLRHFSAAVILGQVTISLNLNFHFYKMETIIVSVTHRLVRTKGNNTQEVPGTGNEFNEY